eukprot:m.522777 g.522777  ORF g.522777 m.522777 type:complete len:672 (-) comp21969_c1_seq6:270-2285(-)
MLSAWMNGQQHHDCGKISDDSVKQQAESILSDKSLVESSSGKPPASRKRRAEDLDDDDSSDDSLASVFKRTGADSDIKSNRHRPSTPSEITSGDASSPANRVEQGNRAAINVVQPDNEKLKLSTHSNNPSVVCRRIGVGEHRSSTPPVDDKVNSDGSAGIPSKKPSVMIRDESAFSKTATKHVQSSVYTDPNPMPGEDSHPLPVSGTCVNRATPGSTESSSAIQNMELQPVANGAFVTPTGADVGHHGRAKEPGPAPPQVMHAPTGGSGSRGPSVGGAFWSLPIEEQQRLRKDLLRRAQSFARQDETGAPQPVPSTKGTPFLCEVCPRVATYLCSHCCSGWYCSRACQLMHLPVHRDKCHPSQVARTTDAMPGPGRADAARTSAATKRRSATPRTSVASTALGNTAATSTPSTLDSFRPSIPSTGATVTAAGDQAPEMLATERVPPSNSATPHDPGAQGVSVATRPSFALQPRVGPSSEGGGGAVEHAAGVVPKDAGRDGGAHTSVRADAGRLPVPSVDRKPSPDHLSQRAVEDARNGSAAGVLASTVVTGGDGAANPGDPGNTASDKRGTGTGGRTVLPCAMCGKRATCKCSVCGQQYYCGRECQIRAWRDHESECNKLAKQKTANPYVVGSGTASAVNQYAAGPGSGVLYGTGAPSEPARPGADNAPSS